MIDRNRRGVGVALVTLMAGVVLLATASAAAAQEAPTIAVTAVDPAAGTIELTNHGDVDADPNGIILCNFPAYAAIEGAPVIAPGASITIDSAAQGVALDPSGGEMGLYLTPSYEDPTQIISYVEWGEPGHQRSGVAVQAGIWAEGVAETSSDGMLSSTTDNPVSPADWAPAPDAVEGDPGESGDTETTGDAPAADEELAQTGVETLLLTVIGATLLFCGLGLLHTRRRAVGRLWR